MLHYHSCSPPYTNYHANKPALIVTALWFTSNFQHTMHRAQDIGIRALEVYFPKCFVSQTDLEVADECVGKYTKGLRQENLGVCSVEEDIHSMSLTVLHNLIKRIGLDLQSIGFLEVRFESSCAPSTPHYCIREIHVTYPRHRCRYADDVRVITTVIMFEQSQINDIGEY